MPHNSSVQISKYIAAVSCSADGYRLGSWSTGKLGCAWVGAWVSVWHGGWVHGGGTNVFEIVFALRDL